MLHIQFSHGLRWNSIESIIYYTLFAIHKVISRTVVDAPLYGTIGSLFALIYLTITITNFGLDLSIAPFFKSLTMNKVCFKKFLFRQLLIQSIIYCIAAGIILFSLSCTFFSLKQTLLLDWPLLFVIAMLIVIEGIKKSLRIILQLAFLTHITALVELFYIISYVTLFWTSYAIKQTVSLYIVFIPMLILSFISTVLLAIKVYRFYYTLTPTPTIHPSLSWKKIGNNRAVNYSYQVTKVIFSSNFLIPFFAVTFGLSTAALLEFVTAFTQFITIIIQKIFGITGQALLSLVKQENLEEKREAFSLASKKLYPLLYVILFVVLIAYKPLCAVTFPHQTEDSSLIALLFFLLLFCENFMILYEKWFIIEEKTIYLILLNGSLVMLFYGLPRILHTTSVIALLLLLMTLRLGSYLLLAKASFYTWKIAVPLSINHRYVGYLMLLALSFYLLL